MESTQIAESRELGNPKPTTARSIEECSLQFPKKKAIRDSSQYYSIKMLTNLFKINPLQEQCKDVFLYSIVAVNIFPETNENTPLALGNQYKRSKLFRGVLEQYFKFYYMSGLVLFGKIHSTLVDNFNVIFKQSLAEEKQFEIIDGQDSLDKELAAIKDVTPSEVKYKIGGFRFEKKFSVSCMEEKENIQSYSQVYKNFLNVTMGKLLGYIDYKKDTTTRKVGYYKKEDVRNANIVSGRLNSIDALYSFPAGKAVCDSYESGKIYFKILPKTIGKSNATYADYFYFLCDKYKHYDEMQIREVYLENVKDRRGIKTYSTEPMKIDDVIWESPFKLFFTNQEGKQLNVGEYYLNHLNISMKDEIIPIAVKYKDRKKSTVGEKCEKIHVPMQFLEVVGNGFETRVNVKNIVQTPLQKWSDISNIKNELIKSYAKIKNIASQDNFTNCIDCSGKNVMVDGIVLEQPGIKFGNKNVAPRETGEFEVRDTTPGGKKTNEGKFVEIFFGGISPQQAQMIYQKLGDASVGMGIKIPSSPFTTQLNIEDNDPKNMEKYGIDIFNERTKYKDQPGDVVFLFTHTGNRDLYKRFKNALNKSDLNIPSQVVLYDERKIHDSNRNGSQFTNIGSQIWAKRGDLIYNCDFSFATSTGVIAYSTINYGKTQTGTSFCLSYSKSKAQYGFLSEGSERNNSRISSVIGKLVQKALKSIWKNITFSVDNLLFYREGVNERQIPDIRNNELIDIINSVNKVVEEIKLNKDAKGEKQRDFFKDLKICFVIVSKFNEIKFFSESSDRGNFNRPVINNIPVGTVIDKTVTHEIFYDFHINSAYSKQGTCNPTHYTVIFDNTELDADTLYRLTFYLTYICMNTVKSIKVPAPGYFVTRRNTFIRDHLDDVINAKLKVYNVSL